MLALPSPPDDSARTPGTERNTSAALAGAAREMASDSMVLTETLERILELRLAVPVTTTRSSFRPSAGAAAAGWASGAGLPAGAVAWAAA
jgi:hypothetical protein